MHLVVRASSRNSQAQQNNSDDGRNVPGVILSRHSVSSLDASEAQQARSWRRVAIWQCAAPVFHECSLRANQGEQRLLLTKKPRAQLPSDEHTHRENGTALPGVTSSRLPKGVVDEVSLIIDSSPLPVCKRISQFLQETPPLPGDPRQRML